MNPARRCRVGYLLADPALDLSRHDDSRIHSQTVRGLRELGHEVRFVAAQSGGVVLTDTGFGLQQFFEAARCGGENGNRSFDSTPVSKVLLQFAERHELPMSLLTTSNLAFCAARRVFRGCDLIHARLSPSDVGALLTARDLKVPLVVQVEAAPPAQGAESPTALVEGSERLAGVALSQSLQDADAIVTVSAPLRDLLIADWGVKPERVTVLRSGVDAPGPLSSDRIAQLRREYQLGAGPILFLAGDRETWHGVDLFLEALVRVRATYPEVMLLVASEAPVPGEILERVASLEVASSVRVLGGVEPEQLSHFVAVADIALVPPAAPPFELPSSQTIIEYMAAGKAIVASRSEQVAELLTGDMAILVEPASRDLARAMERLLGDDDLRMGLGARARCEAEREQSWALYVRRLAAVYESVRVE